MMYSTRYKTKPITNPRTIPNVLSPKRNEILIPITIQITHQQLFICLLIELIITNFQGICQHNKMMNVFLKFSQKRQLGRLVLDDIRFSSFLDDDMYVCVLTGVILIFIVGSFKAKNCYLVYLISQDG